MKVNNGVFIMAGLIILGLMIPRTADHLRSYDRTVNVKGLCEKEVKADKVIWPLVIKAGGDNIQELFSTINSQNETLKQFVTSAGIPAECISISMSTSDKTTLDYSNDRVYRFIVKSVMTVCTDKVDEVLKLQSRQDELMSRGILFESDWENRTIFEFTGLNDIKPGMIEEATANARETAQKFAEDSHSRLGKIKTASQGTFSIEDRDFNTPYIKKVRVVSSVTYYLSK